jgi:hypothetical protein
MEFLVVDIDIMLEEEVVVVLKVQDLVELVV